MIMEPHFILSKRKIIEQVDSLRDLGLEISYSYKTNHEVGNILQKVCKDVSFSIHSEEEIDMIKDKTKIIFFTQAENKEKLKEIMEKGVCSFVVDNEVDFRNLIDTIEEIKKNISLSLRMKFSEHRIGTGKYFVYGMPSTKVNQLISEIKDNAFIENVGIHIHRKSQNISEWEIKSELEDSLTKETLERINFVNLGGGLPSQYKSARFEVLSYIFDKLKLTKDFLAERNIKTIIEPGRFIAAPSVKLKTEIIQIQEKNLIINTTIYNCALDCILTGTKMLIEEELEDNEDGDFYLIKGNSPTRDDIFRYKVKLKEPKVGDKITFLNAGAYNYTTDFFGYKKLETKIVD